MATGSSTIYRSFGYGRLSVQGNFTTRLDLANHLGVAPNNLFCEHQMPSLRWSGRAFLKLIGSLSPGDLVVLPALSHLGDHPTEVLERIGMLSDLGVIVRILKENIDTSRPRGRFVLRTILAMATLAKPTTAAGRVPAQSGSGRPRSVSPAIEADIVKMRDEDGLTPAEIAARLPIGRSTVYAVLSRLKPEKSSTVARWTQESEVRAG